MPKRNNSSVAPDEIARFSAHAQAWWNPNGPLRPLHRLNPVRIAYVRDHIVEHFHCDADARYPLKDLALLDVGCGGGLLAEPLSRLGAKVTGLDASAEAIAEARRHAKESGVAVDYRAGSVEGLAQQTLRYDIITALEIVEHVADLDAFIAALATLLKPNGLLILSTLNRTPKSFLLGIIAAEYVLRWVPRGTHHWKKFLRPSELVQKLKPHHLTPTDLTGIVYQAATNEFALSKNNLDVNYLLTAVKR